MKVPPFKIDSYIDNIAANKDICAVVIYGPEAGLSLIRSKKIAQSIVPNVNDPFLVSNISESQLIEDQGLLADEFCSIPMLGGRKLIKVSNAGNKITESLKIVFGDSKKDYKKPVGDNFILITAGDLETSSSLRKFAESNPYVACMACYEDNEATTKQIIRQKLGEYNLVAQNGVVEFIVSKFGKNRLIILNELEKLSLFMGEEKNITMDVVNQAISDISEVSANQFVNYFVDLNLSNALYFLEKLLIEKVNSVTIIRFLSNYFLKLQIVKNNIENGANLDIEIKSQRIFFKQEVLFKKHLNMWSKNSIDNIILKLQELEVNCKSVGASPAILLSSFVNFVYLKYQYQIRK